MIAGLVLAGGESRRMGTDKALIPIHGKPAYLYMAELLSACCDKVYVGCREDQQLNFEGHPKIVGLFDRPAHAGRGPMSGILSYLGHSADNQVHTAENPATALDPQSITSNPQPITHPDGLLILGCDYRNMTQEVLFNLLAVGQTQNRICCYQNHLTGFIEPLVAYYPSNVLSKLPAFAEENSSLRAFIEAHNPCILPTDPQILPILRSFDH